MAKFHGPIGFVTTIETAPSVHREVVTEYNYYGDVIRDSRRFQSGDGLNDNLQINNQISVIGNPYAYDNFPAMRYIGWMGSYWKITNVEVQRPRLILSIGGLYNKPDPYVEPEEVPDGPEA
jgi:hypothetical protein